MQNPKPFLYGLIGKKVCVRLKWGETEYEGTLASVDSYMDLQLDETEEYINGESQGVLGEVLIRCNNVLWVGEARERATEPSPLAKRPKTEDSEPIAGEDSAA